MFFCCKKPNTGDTGDIAAPSTANADGRSVAQSTPPPEPMERSQALDLLTQDAPISLESFRQILAGSFSRSTTEPANRPEQEKINQDEQALRAASYHRFMKNHSSDQVFSVLLNTDALRQEARTRDDNIVIDTLENGFSPLRSLSSDLNSQSTLEQFDATASIASAVLDVLTPGGNKTSYALADEKLRGLAPQALVDQLVGPVAVKLTEILCACDSHYANVKAYGARLRGLPEAVLGDALTGWRLLHGTAIESLQSIEEIDRQPHPANLVAYAEIVLDCFPDAEKNVRSAYWRLLCLTSVAHRQLAEFQSAPTVLRSDYLNAIDAVLNELRSLPSSIKGRIVYAPEQLEWLNELRNTGEVILQQTPGALKSDQNYIRLSQWTLELKDLGVARVAVEKYAQAVKGVVHMLRVGTAGAVAAEVPP